MRELAADASGNRPASLGQASFVHLLESPVRQSGSWLAESVPLASKAAY